jgi:glutathione S-transferase
MADPQLYIGNKRYSSWSLRAWLVLKKSGLEFKESFIALDQAATRSTISKVSPGGTVPVLHTDDAVIWDSLAIAEWAAEQVPALWPEHAGVRARARAASCAMHAGFYALRETCPMDLGRVMPDRDLSDETRADVAAVQALWHDVASPDGPWLFGRWSIADAFFAPLATRFRTYGIPLHAAAQDYCDALLADEDFLTWQAGADREEFPNPYENLI